LGAVLLLLAFCCGSPILAQPRIIAWGDNSSGQTAVPTGIPDLAAVAGGYYHALAMRSNGTVVAWGDNSAGQTNVPSWLTGVKAIAAGEYHSLALRTNGTVVAWGQNNYRQTNAPFWLSNVTAIAAGASHCLALRSNGTVVAWGNNTLGQTNVPAGLNGVKAIAAGDVHCLVLKTNGTLLAWGNNDSGQTNIPPGLTDIMAIAAGYHHNVAVRSNGTVVAWELNVYGETTVPPGLSGVVAVGGGYFYSEALKSDGTMISWGDTDLGKTPVPLGLSGVTSFSAGHTFTLALTPNPLCPPGFPDNFECRQVLTGSSLSFSSSNLGATVEPGEPSVFGFQDSPSSVWYSWTAPYSGGAVLNVTATFPTPCLAAYTGTNFASLIPLGSNYTAFSQGRLVWDATAGTTYAFVLNGVNNFVDPDQGNFTASLDLVPRPANDSFANRTAISGGYYLTSGSFIGATQEAGEPSHAGSNGNPALTQTLWWTWAAPTNLGVTLIPVSLVADAVSFPPNLAVYTGTSLAGLTRVPVTSQTNGMSRFISFLATAGTNYQIALGGRQYDSLGIYGSPRYGNFDLRLNIRALVLTVANLVTNDNFDGTLSFQANLLVTNFGSAASNPLRIQVAATSGESVRGPDSGVTTNARIQIAMTNQLALNPGQGRVLQITGVTPAPTANAGNTFGVGYGIYGSLQEQVDTNWLTLDQALVLFGVWPDLNGFGGPGGGVVRLDPSLTGAGFDALSSVSILGPASLNEGTTATYKGLANYASGYQYYFSNTTWTASRFSITTNGVFTPGIVTSNTVVSLSAAYSSGGFNYTAGTSVTVLNLPSPRLTQPLVTGGTTFSMHIQGVPQRKVAIEAAFALTNPVPWVVLSTNTLDAGGLFTFQYPLGGNGKRFFRVREVP
jgi:hypothetical protein